MKFSGNGKNILMIVWNLASGADGTEMRVHSNLSTLFSRASFSKLFPSIFLVYILNEIRIFLCFIFDTTESLHQCLIVLFVFPLITPTPFVY